MPRIDLQKLEAVKAYQPEVAVEDGSDQPARVDPTTLEPTFFVDGVEGAESFAATPSPGEDFGRIARLIEGPTAFERARGLHPQVFASLLTDTLEHRAAYFSLGVEAARSPRSRFETSNILGQRTTQLIEEARALADALYAEDLDARDAAYVAANACIFELLARLGGSRGSARSTSSGHDAALIHAWEHRLGELDQVAVEQLTADQAAEHERERQQIRRELDAICRDRFLYDNESMLETNAEESVGLCLIEPKSQRRVSETRASERGGVPAYELLALEVEGEHRSVYFDRERDGYYFDRTSDPVPRAAWGRIERTPIPESEAALFTFRRPVGNEHLRRNFRYDWTGDGYVQSSVVEWVGWAGHCSEKASVEALLVPRATAGVFAYPSVAGGLQQFDPKLLDEATMATAEACVGPWSPDPGVLQTLDAAIRSARLFALETELGVRLWTGRTDALDAVTVRRDAADRWAVVSLEAGASPGRGARSFLVRLGEAGRPAYAVSLEPAAQPASSSRPAGLSAGTPLEPALASAVSGRLTADLAGNLLDLVCLGYGARPHALLHAGVHLFFESTAACEAEKSRRGRLRAAIYGGGPLGGPASGALLEHQGRVRRGEDHHLEVTAPADGPLVFLLETREGDADLFVKLGGPASHQDYTRKADARGLTPDEVVLEARAGDRVHIAVHAACEDSAYRLRVMGPRPSAGDGCLLPVERQGGLG